MPVVVLNHQCVGFLLLPRGPVITASIPKRGSSLRVIRILLPTIFQSRAWYLASPSSACLVRSAISSLRVAANWSARASILAWISLEVFRSDMTRTNTSSSTTFTPTGALETGAQSFRQSSNQPWLSTVGKTTSSRMHCLCRNESKSYLLWLITSRRVVGDGSNRLGFQGKQRGLIAYSLSNY